MHKKDNRIKRVTALLAVLLCTCGILAGSDIWRTYAASGGGQTVSSDTLNVNLAAGTGQEAVMGSLSEGTYTDSGDGATGTIALDNASVGGYMHVNVGQTLDMYAPNSDVDYMDQIGFSGNYTFMAAGGMGGGINASDSYAGWAFAYGGYGSSITNSSIDYSSGQQITYRKGSNGITVPVSQATNTSYWDSNTSIAVLSSFMGSRINGGLVGEAMGYRGWSAVAQAGSASYIQVSGDSYIVAGGGAPGVVMFRCLNGSYKAEGLAGMHADVTPPLPAGCNGFYNPGSPDMSRRYRDYNGTSNINAGRIVGATVKNGLPVVNAFGGGVKYEDMFYGWVTDHGNTRSSLSNVYPGYSGLASRSGSKFDTAGMNDSAYRISVNSSAAESSPYVRLKCNAKYITVSNPTRTGYDFTGWTCSPGVTVVSQTNSGCKFKVTASGATVTANWKANKYWITFEGNGADGGATPEQTCLADKTYRLNANGFRRTGYTFAGWSLTPDGDVSYADQASVCNLAGGGTYVVLYAKWTANPYTIVFDPNGGMGHLDGIAAEYDQEITLPDGAAYFKKYTRDNENVTEDVLNGTLTPAGETETSTDAETKAYESVFLGWALEDGKDLFTPQRLVGETVQNLTEENGATVTLYAVWDDCPWIHAEDLYFSLKEAQAGKLTYDFLMGYAEAEDREDGSPILPGEHEDGTSFRMTNYAPTDFTQFDASGAASETFEVVDSAGSVYRKKIMVYVVDTTPVIEKPIGYTRFINEYYYYQPYELGGLKDDSVWKTDPEYVEVILSAFENRRNNTPERVYEFTHEEILEMKEFVRENGIGNIKYDDALQRFYDQFMAPNRTK